MDAHGHGQYEPLDPQLLPPLYIAFQRDLAELSDIFHNNIRQRYQSGEESVVKAISLIADLARRGRQALLAGDHAELSRLINLNFDTRRSIYHLSSRHIRMVELARSLGASAKFAGSGGSIIGTYRDEEMFRQLERAFASENCSIIKPAIV
jgi:glucuronokinase